jgi:hypothetical protein
MVTRRSCHDLTPQTAELLERVGVHPSRDGYYDVGSLRVHVDPAALDEADLIVGSNRCRVSRYDLAANLATTILQYRSTQDSRTVAALLFADNGWTVVYWDGGGACAFRKVRAEHLRVLRAIADSLSCASERRAAEISFADTVLVVSALYGCHGSHRRHCPHPGERHRSLINEDGVVDSAKLGQLRALG